MHTTNSERLFAEAQTLIPGGVNSPVRAMRSIGRDHPIFVDRAEGFELIDVEVHQKSIRNIASEMAEAGYSPEEAETKVVPGGMVATTTPAVLMGSAWVAVLPNVSEYVSVSPGFTGLASSPIKRRSPAVPSVTTSFAWVIPPPTKVTVAELCMTVPFATELI